jgi:hypothetical protein
MEIIRISKAFETAYFSMIPAGSTLAVVAMGV